MSEPHPEPLVLPPGEMAAVRRVAAALEAAGWHGPGCPHDGPARHQAMRGDDVEAWLKHWRHEREDDLYPYAWTAIDSLLDDYRAHADTGTPLDAAVRERDEP